jgi:hypothetical protein
MNEREARRVGVRESGVRESGVSDRGANAVEETKHKKSTRGDTAATKHESQLWLGSSTSGVCGA